MMHFCARVRVGLVNNVGSLSSLLASSYADAATVSSQV
jgi:hypothetical protein